MPLKIPNVAAKKAAGKAASKIRVKTPFSKPRKVPPANQKPETCTQDKWGVDCMRRRYTMAAQRHRRLAQGEKKARVANTMHVTALTTGASIAS
jgi:hypothetical protein